MPLGDPEYLQSVRRALAGRYGHIADSSTMVVYYYGQPTAHAIAPGLPASLRSRPIWPLW